MTLKPPRRLFCVGNQAEALPSSNGHLWYGKCEVATCLAREKFASCACVELNLEVPLICGTILRREYNIACPASSSTPLQ